MKTTRRAFIAGLAAACRVVEGECLPKGDAVWRWKPGHFQIHLIYTGTAESQLLIFPDSTSVLLDCGDSDPHTFDVKRFGRKELPILPSEEKRAGEWIARYVLRTNPNGGKVDYMVISHFHGDHCGSFGTPGGFTLAAEQLRFGKALDRGWPDYNDPLPYPESENWMGGTLTLMKRLYEKLSKRDGLTVEKFAVGAHNQLKMLHEPEKYPGFSSFNLCGNGKVAMPDGSIYDVYAHEHSLHKHCIYNENAMSLGNIFTYGAFKYYTAGDFTASDGRKGLWNGEKTDIEKILAKACPKVDAAKANHHAAWSSPAELVRALAPKVWFAPVWWQLQCDKKTMNRLAGRSEEYPGARLLMPGVMAEERRKADAGEAYLADVPECVYSPQHTVVDVPPGGEEFRVIALDASDEEMRTKKEYIFPAKQAKGKNR